MKIPDNYRQLKRDEIIRAEDIYQPVANRNVVSPVKYSIGDTAGSLPNYSFWRRRHTKKVVAVPSPTPTIKKGSKVVAVVSFSYRDSRNHFLKAREVQVVSLDDTYLIGLEITRGKYRGETPTYQFKRYRRDRIAWAGEIFLKEFTVS